MTAFRICNGDEKDEDIFFRHGGRAGEAVTTSLLICQCVSNEFACRKLQRFSNEGGKHDAGRRGSKIARFFLFGVVGSAVSGSFNQRCYPNNNG